MFYKNTELNITQFNFTDLQANVKSDKNNNNDLTNDESILF